ncbi:MAG: hypothetical protein GC191_09480 [Azospirillum sp.]|nr:hypothetical protein [Azospirillum sp.]
MLTILTPPTESALVDLATVKDEFGIQGTDHDARLTRWIRQATARLASACGRDGFGRIAAEERFDHHQSRLKLSWRPVNAVTSVVVAGTPLGSEEWRLDGRFLDRLVMGRPACWSMVPILVTYDAGWDLPDGAPDELVEACIALVKAHWHGRDRDPALRNESVEGVMSQSWQTVGDTGVPPGILDPIIRYRWE